MRADHSTVAYTQPRKQRAGLLRLVRPANVPAKRRKSVPRDIKKAERLSIGNLCSVIALCAFVYPFLVAGTAAAAQGNGIPVLRGTVLDPAARAIENAGIVARNESSGAITKTSTDQAGRFAFANLTSGTYTVEVSAPGFSMAVRQGVRITADHAEELSISLTLGTVREEIAVEANAYASVAAQRAPMDGLMEARSARSEVNPAFIQNFTSPVSDYSELLQMAPGTFSVNPNGVGLGDSKTFFRGFADGNYNINFDG